MGRRTLPGAVATRDWQRTTFGPRGKRVLPSLAEAFFTDPADRGAEARFAWLVDDVDVVFFIGRWLPVMAVATEITKDLLRAWPRHQAAAA